MRIIGFGDLHRLDVICSFFLSYTHIYIYFFFTYYVARTNYQICTKTLRKLLKFAPILVNRIGHLHCTPEPAVRALKRNGPCM